MGKHLGPGMLISQDIRSLNTFKSMGIGYPVLLKSPLVPFCIMGLNTFENLAFRYCGDECYQMLEVHRQVGRDSCLQGSIPSLVTDSVGVSTLHYQPTVNSGLSPNPPTIHTQICLASARTQDLDPQARVPQ